MSFVTRCISCGTLFKVVADQLKVLDGWVRCGQCGKVFDAQVNRVDDETARPIAKAAINAPAPALAITADRHSSAPAPTPKRHEGGRVNTQGAASEAIWVESRFTPETPDASRSSRVKTKTAKREKEKTEPAHSNTLAIQTWSHYDDLRPSFVKKAVRAARWDTTPMRVGLVLIGLVLFCSLILQVLYHNRSYVSANWPNAARYFMRMCESNGCVIAPLRQIESIVIDGSSFQLVRSSSAAASATPQIYRLTVLLKNTGQLATALPHIELSLQDSLHQAAIRRVFTPDELGMSAAAIAPASIVSASATVQVNENALSGNRLMGYSVLAFYP